VPAQADGGGQQAAGPAVPAEPQLDAGDKAKGLGPDAGRQLRLTDQAAEEAAGIHRAADLNHQAAAGKNVFGERKGVAHGAASVRCLDPGVLPGTLL
jgi:hypothetical protein